jgi:DNA helicase II / ATP-dependent DNA helicase PcrA
MDQTLKNLFDTNYQALNEQQKVAVDEIYGPVMVIAGPGTGKTQLLSVRVCNILQKTDLSPYNILCLTYTDAGVTAMRERLIQMLGSDAYQVGIYTYHAFCNMVIRENPEDFKVYRELRNANDLEIVEIIKDVMDNLPVDHPNTRHTGDIDFDFSKWKSLFNTMKSEGWSAKFVEEKIGEYIEDMPNLDKYQYKRDKGPNYTEITREVKKLSFVEHGAKFIKDYNEGLNKRQLFDFHDSILNVLAGFKSNKDLLLRYQEKFQFILADEYQDTNGAQNEILFKLAENDFDDRPNIFVVGDDDQCIYRFQGANLDNIIIFKEKFNPLIVILKNNYRSYQGVLDKARQLIEYNKQRLINIMPNLDKNLLESRKKNFGVGSEPILYTLSNSAAHNYQCINLIKSIHASGVPYNEIAVIYQKHVEAVDIIKYLTYSGIPVSIKKRINILKLKETKRLVTLIKYIIKEVEAAYSGDGDLFNILHFDFWKIPPRDVAKVSIGAYKNNEAETDKIRWRDYIAEPTEIHYLSLSQPNLLISASKILEELIVDYANDTVQVFFEKVITKTGLLDSILRDKDKVFRISVVNTLFDFIKNETSANPDVTMLEIFERFDKMEDFKIDLPINSMIYNNEGVNFLTAHSSKGLEFEEVIILNVRQGNWDKSRNNTKPYFGPTVMVRDVDNDEEDYRRLFYVALTRAKNRAHLLYPRADDSHKLFVHHPFISNMGYETTTKDLEVDEEEIVEYASTVLKYDKGIPSLIEHDLLDYTLQNLSLNPTGLNKYLRCPLEYYFENIIRVPQARSSYTGLGNAVHKAMESFIIKIQSDPERNIPDVSIFKDMAGYYVDKYKSHFSKVEYERTRYYLQQASQDIYEKYSKSWSNPRQLMTEHTIEGSIDGIPIKGIMDRIDIYDDHIEVIDYKTGSFDSAKHKVSDSISLGGDYWRQSVFYDILIDLDPKLKNKKRGITFIYLLKEMKEMKSTHTLEEKEIVIQQIKETYDNIRAHKFDQGCGKGDCKWCTFVKENMPIS